MTKEEVLRMIDEEQAKHKCYIEFDKSRITAENQGELAKFIDTVARCEKADSGMYIICELARQYVELPRGKWIEERLDKYKKYKITCPFCKMEYVDNYDGYIDAIDFNFCPNCGASMSANDRQVTGKLKQPCPCETCQTAIDRCGCQMHLCSDYQKWKEGDEK